VYLSLIEDLTPEEVYSVKRRILSRLRVEVTEETAARVGIPRRSDGTVSYLDGVYKNPFQERIHFPDPSNDWRYQVVCTGKRFSKSITAGAEVVTESAFRKRHIWIVAPTYHLTDNVYRWVWKWIVEQRCFGPDSIEKASWTRDLRYIKLKPALGGSIIEGKTAESPISLMGTPLNLIVLDEAAFVPETIWSDKLEPNTLDYHGRTLFTSTPNGKNWYEKYYQRGQTKDTRSKGWQSFNAPTSANPFIDPVWLGSKRHEITEVLWKQNYLGLFESLAGMVYPDFLAKHHTEGGHLIQPSEFVLADRTHYLGIDIGVGHPTAGVWGAVDRKGQVILYRDYLDVQPSYGEHADSIRAHNTYPLAGAFISHDASRTQKTEKGKKKDNALKAFRRRGLPVRPANSDVDLGISVVNEYIRGTLLTEGTNPGMLISTECVDLIEAKGNYIWGQTRDGESTGKPRKKDDDLDDAERYLLVDRPIFQPAVSAPRYGNSGGIEVPASAMQKYGDVYIPGGN